MYSEGGVGQLRLQPPHLTNYLDCENGSKYFGLRIAADVALIEKWDYAGVCTDRILRQLRYGDHRSNWRELMEKLRSYVNKSRQQIGQRDGNATMAGWGALKCMRTFLKICMRDSGKHIVIVKLLIQRRKDDDGRVDKRNGSHKTI